VFTVQELYAYSSRVRHRFVDKLNELRWEELERNREASFYSMKNVMIHMIDNEDWIVNWVIQGKSGEYVRKKSAEYTSKGMLVTHLDEVEQKTRLYLQDLDEVELNRKVRFTLSSGQVFDLSVEECLFQSFTEQLFHLGEIIALMWQDNIEPPRMQWFWNNPRELTEQKQSKGIHHE
jgi:uncharacterized damage-inducible protein DinB